MRRRAALLLDAAGLTPDAALRAAAEDERVDELLVLTVEAAATTADDRKVAALGRALRTAIDAPAGDTDPTLDEARLVAATIARLDTAHIRLVDLLVRSEQPRVESHGGGSYTTRRDFHLSSQLKGTTGLPERVWPVLAGDLVTLGVLLEERAAPASRSGVGGLGRPTDPLRSWAFTDFGRAVVRVLGTDPTHPAGPTPPTGS
ncbi:hypothetical protein PO878_13105 [Iamia majanohamensis]|uniref:Uncharacterized protein n=1 Tax=Iamia majanohamensis TaxID=467976 RepID=A0AAE9Y3M2_9ACTN|nr:hypothetical protein [Iamia majanohamensis]WCO65434.1 hypothetical protein PO878_13105 [Iamia majanohamensis]